MIKKLFIVAVVLGIVFLAAAYLTRPTDLKGLSDVALNQLPPDQRKIVDMAGGESAIAGNLGKQVVLKDRYFWTSAKVNGHTVFTGAFGHWFPRIDKAYEALLQLENLKDKAMAEANKAVDQAKAQAEKAAADVGKVLPAGAADPLKNALPDAANPVKLPPVKLPGQN